MNKNNTIQTSSVETPDVKTSPQTEVVGGTTVAANPPEVSQESQLEKHQVADFVSTEPKAIVGYDTSMDSTADQAQYGAMGLADFLARPVKIQTYVWSVGGGVSVYFDPWVDFLSNAAVKRKLDNYSLVRFNLHVQFQYNGSPFHYGRLICAYNPFSIEDGFGQGVTLPAVPTEHLRIRYSQLPHVFINPTTNQTLQLDLPYVNYDSWINVTADKHENRKLGTIYIQTFNDLAVATSNPTSDLNITVYAYATNVEISVPTNGLAQAGVEDEHQPNGIVSTVAAAVASAAGRLAKAPIIGPYAKATEIGAGAIASIAKIFGFSRTNIVTDPMFMKNQPFASLANSMGSETVSKLSFDPKQETTLAADVAGYSNKDEMTIASIVGRESFIHAWTWASADGSGTVVGVIEVSPTYAQKTNIINDSWVLTTSALAGGCLPFKYWSGSIIYRFQIVASAYHRGRLRFVYEPNGAAFSSDSLNTTSNIVIDLESSLELELVISWGQTEPYLQIDDLRSVKTSTSVPGTYAKDFNNGRIYITVQNELSSPLTTADVYINGFARAGPDFEVFAPQPVRPGFLNFEKLEQHYPEEEALAAKSNDDVLNSSQEPTVAGEAQAGMEDCDQLVATAKVDLIGPPNVEAMESKAMIFHGDPIRSFRALLRRYQLVDMLHEKSTNSGGTTLFWFYRPNFPPPGGLSDNAYQNGQDTNNYPTTLLAYLREFYVGWRGSVRWKLSSNPLNFEVHSITAARASETLGVDASLWSNREDIAYSDNQTTAALKLIINQPHQTWSGAYLTSFDNQSGVEYDLPFYNTKRFYVQSGLDGPAYASHEDGMEDAFHRVTVIGNPTTASSAYIGLRYIAIGDDFNFVWFLGSPHWFYQSTNI